LIHYYYGVTGQKSAEYKSQTRLGNVGAWFWINSKHQRRHTSFVAYV